MSGFTQVAVSGQYLNPSTGAPRTGTVTFTLGAALRNGDQTTGTSWTATLASDGSFSISLPATNDLGTTPAGSVYRVTESLDGGTAGGSYALTVSKANAATGIRLAATPALGQPAAKPVVTGAKGGSAALGSLLSALSGLGLLTDNTTA